MQLTCPCMNVAVFVRSDSAAELDARKVDPSTLGLLPDEVQDPFFANHTLYSVVPENGGISEKLPMLVQHRPVGSWTVYKCLVCTTVAVGVNRVHMVTTDKLIRSGEPVIMDVRKRVDLSPVFGVILPKKESASPTVATNGFAGELNAAFAGIGGSRSVHKVQAIAHEYLKKEQEKMEERIKAFVEEQHQKFDELRTDVKYQKNVVLSLLQQNTSVSDCGGVDDDNDSAVPISPFSLNSGDPSPTPGVPASKLVADWSCTPAVPVVSLVEPPRPKSHSVPNPSSMSRLRKRHSGGSGTPRALTRHPEEVDVFSFDDTINPGLTENAASDNEGDTDDSGTGEDYCSLYPAPPPAPRVITPRTVTGKNAPQFGTSLPMGIPQRTHFRSSSEDDEETQVGRRRGPADVAESMKQLTMSMCPQDHPERLFGDRPERRRYKTGDILVQHFDDV